MTTIEVSVALEEEFVASIDKFVQTSSFGWEDREEFLKEAIRTYYRKMKD